MLTCGNNILFIPMIYWINYFNINAHYLAFLVYLVFS